MYLEREHGHKKEFPDYLTTFSGKKFSFTNPQPDQICIEDIAHSLSNICRFVGHTRNHYSVAEHSIYVSHYVKPQNKLIGLLHDASEAYLGDVASPLKVLLPNYKELEKKVSNVIFEALGIEVITTKTYDDVKRADNLMLEKEFSFIVNEDWSDRHYFTMRYMSRDEIKTAFLDYYDAYKA